MKISLHFFVVTQPKYSFNFMFIDLIYSSKY